MHLLRSLASSRSPEASTRPKTLQTVLCHMQPPLAFPAESDALPQPCGQHDVILRNMSEPRSTPVTADDPPHRRHVQEQGQRLQVPIGMSR